MNSVALRMVASTEALLGAAWAAPANANARTPISAANLIRTMVHPPVLLRIDSAYDTGVIVSPHIREEAHANDATRDGAGRPGSGGKRRGARLRRGPGASRPDHRGAGARLSRQWDLRVPRRPLW